MMNFNRLNQKFWLISELYVIILDNGGYKDMYCGLACQFTTINDWLCISLICNNFV